MLPSLKQIKVFIIFYKIKFYEKNLPDMDTYYYFLFVGVSSKAQVPANVSDSLELVNFYDSMYGPYPDKS